MEQSNLLQKIIVPVLTLILIFVLFIIYFGSMHSVKTDTVTFPIAKPRIDPFKNLQLSAKAAMVWDVKEQKVLFEQKSDMVLPLASLAKVMLAVTAADTAPAYTSVAIKKEFLEEEGDTGLFVDEKWKLKDLLDFSLTTSSNDGSRAIASVIGATKTGSQDIEASRRDFVNLMNEKAKEGISHKNHPYP